MKIKVIRRTGIPRYRRKIFVKGAKEYTEKILSNIPELYSDIEVIKLSVQEDHVHMVVVILPRIAVDLRSPQLLLGEVHSNIKHDVK